MITAMEASRSELAALLGDARVVSDPVACATFAVDGKVPAYVVYPSSAGQVAALLKCCADRALAVIPCRNGTKLGIGNPPARYDVAISLKDLNQVWYYEPADLTVSVEPGMKLADFQHFIGRHRLWLPLDPPGGERASLGGILATNASGPLRVAYGGPRDMVIGMKIATTEGKIVKTGGRVVKNVAGYDMGKLLIGSYGTLGVIVEVSFKLYPLPAASATFIFAADTLVRARELRRSIQRSPLQPMRLLLIDAEAARLVRTDVMGQTDRIGSGASLLPGARGGAEMWFEAAGSPRLLERYERDARELARMVDAPIEKVDASVADSAWSRLAGFHTWVAKEAPSLVALKAALPIAALEDFLGRVRQEADRGSLRLATFAQPGVGIAHLCLLEVKQVDTLRGLVDRVRKLAAEIGGSLVIERCSTELKNAVDVWGPAGDEPETMRKVKSAWDPKGILSPGRFVGRL